MKPGNLLFTVRCQFRGDEMKRFLDESALSDKSLFSARRRVSAMPNISLSRYSRERLFCYLKTFIKMKGYIKNE